MSSTNMNKKLSIALIVVALIALGGYFYPGSTSSTVIQQVPSPSFGTASPAGSTFNTAKIAAVAMAPATGSATSSSITNTDATDRYVLATEIGCQNIGTSLTAYTGTGLANLLLTIGTTTVAGSNLAPWARIGQITVATATPQSFLSASSTLLTATSSLAAIWHTGENMQFTWNATNTASCSVGIRYIGS